MLITMVTISQQPRPSSRTLRVAPALAAAANGGTRTTAPPTPSTNELYLAVVASLANRVSGDKQSEYRDAANGQANWLFGAGLQNANNNFVDRLDMNGCGAQGPVWSYNQGVILGALVEMNKLTGDSSYLDKADAIAQGTLDHLTMNGILTEGPCLLYTSPSPRDGLLSRMPSSA